MFFLKDVSIVGFLCGACMLKPKIHFLKDCKKLLKKINVFRFFVPSQGLFVTPAWGIAKNPQDIEKALIRPYTPRKDVLGVRLGYTAQKDLVFQTRTQELHHKVVYGGSWSKRFLLAGDICQQKQNAGSLLFVFEDGDGLFRWMTHNKQKFHSVFHIDLKEHMFGWWFLSPSFLGDLIFHECQGFGAEKEECFILGTLIVKLRKQYDKTQLLRMIERGNMVFDWYKKNERYSSFNRERVLAILTHLQSWKVLPKEQEEQAFSRPTFFTNCQGREHMVVASLDQVCYHRLSYCLADQTNRVGEKVLHDTDVVFFDVGGGNWNADLLARAQGSNMTLTRLSEKRPAGEDLTKWCVLHLCYDDKGFDMLHLGKDKKQALIAGLWKAPTWGLRGQKRNQMFAE